MTKEHCQICNQDGHLSHDCSHDDECKCCPCGEECQMFCTCPKSAPHIDNEDHRKSADKPFEKAWTLMKSDWWETIDSEMEKPVARFEGGPIDCPECKGLHGGMIREEEGHLNFVCPDCGYMENAKYFQPLTSE